MMLAAGAPPHAQNAAEILFGHYFVRAALALQKKMSIHLHQDFLSGVFLFDFFAKVQTRSGKVANVHNDQVIPAQGRVRVADCRSAAVSTRWPCMRSISARRCCTVASPLTSSMREERLARGIRKRPWIDFSICPKPTPVRAPARHPFTVTRSGFFVIVPAPFLSCK